MKGSKFAVFGVGKYGSAIAKTLAKKGSEVHVFDISSEKIETLKDEVALAVALDSTDKKALMAQDLNGFDAAVVAIGENFEGVILTTSNLMDLGVKRIIARATGLNQEKILTKIGVEEILLPEDEVADSVAEKLINPNITAFLQLPDEYEIAEIRAPKKITNETLKSLQLNKKYHLTLITIKRVFEIKKKGELVAEEHIIGVTNAETIIYDTDTLVVFGSFKNIKKFIEINE
ncbi:MAG: TrkA family potassium uptake protein [Flavobacteriales bacterium]